LIENGEKKKEVISGLLAGDVMAEGNIQNPAALRSLVEPHPAGSNPLDEAQQPILP